MRDRILLKLRSARGESFTELLVAVLVASIAVALLAGMITSSANLSRRGAEATASMYEALSAAELAPASGAEKGDVTATVRPAIGAPVTVTFEDAAFSGDRDILCAYTWIREAQNNG